MTTRPPSHCAPRLLIVLTLLASIGLPSLAGAKGILPGDGNLKIRVGDDTRSPVVLLIDTGIIYEGERKDENKILFNFRGDLVRKARERSGDHLLRIRDNAVVDAENNTVFIVSGGKLFGPDDRRTAL